MSVHWCLVLLVVLGAVTITQAELPVGCRDEIDLVFLVDNSASIREDNPFDGSSDNWELIKKFINNVITEFMVYGNDTRFALARFSSETNIEIRFTDMLDHGEIQKRIESMAYSGQNTNTAEALDAMLKEVFVSPRKNAHKVLVVLTDGLSNENTDQTSEKAWKLKLDDVWIATVALTVESNEPALKSLASYPSSTHHVEAGGIKNQDLLKNQLIPVICGLERPPLCPPGQYFDGKECTDCLLQVDLTILMDDSGSIRDKNPPDGSYDNYAILKRFIKNLVSRLPVAHNETRIAIIKFSSKVQIELKLNDLYNAHDIENKIDEIGYWGGHTKTGEAIDMMREQIYREENGDRQEALNVAILITDGESTNQSLTLRAAAMAKKENIRFFTVGITNQINETELKIIASNPIEDHFYNSTNFQQLNSLLTKLIKHVCTKSPTTTLSRKTRDLTNMENIQDMSHSTADTGSHFPVAWSLTSLATVLLIWVVLYEVKEKRNIHLLHN